MRVLVWDETSGRSKNQERCATARSGGGIAIGDGVIVLATTDPPEQVIDFYEGVLTGWNRREINDTSHFWLGEDEYDPLAKSGKITPSIQVIRAGDIRLIPGAQTEIQVRYLPGGGYR